MSLINDDFDKGFAKLGCGLAIFGVLAHVVPIILVLLAIKWIFF